MKIYRVVAVHRDGGHQNSDYKVVIICGINEAGKLEINCEWLGYYQNNELICPFLLKSGSSFFYGWDDHYCESTNIGTKIIQPKEFFTVFVSEGSEAIYEIISCHLY